MTYAVLCSDTGKTICGADGVLPMDQRHNFESCERVIFEYRHRFKKHFRWKFEFWTCFFFVDSLKDIPVNEVSLGLRSIHRIPSEEGDA